MYMLLDVNSPLSGQSLNAAEPWTSYYAGYLNHTFAVVEAFSSYPNTLLFFSGNEDIQTVASAKFVPQYLRSVTRDLKNYIKNNIQRDIPVGYSAADVRTVLFDTWNYMQCTDPNDPDNMSQSDLFALNSYSWCGIDATFDSSTYNQLVAGFKDTAIPVFFSEYGCIKPPPRYWNETGAIYGTDMDGTFSGAVAYQWTQDVNDFGIVDVSGDSTTLLAQYNMFKDKLALINWDTVTTLSTTSNPPTAPVCKAGLITEAAFNSNFTLIPVPPGAQTLIDNGIAKKPSGQLVTVKSYDVTMTVLNEDGTKMTGLKVVPVKDTEYNVFGNNDASTGSSSNSSSGNSTGSTGTNDNGDSAAAFMQPLVWAAALPLLAMLFA